MQKKTQSKKVKHKEVAGQLSDSVLQAIEKDISSNVVDLGDKQITINTSSPPPAKSPKKNEEQQKLHTILKKKEELQNQLAWVKQKYKNIKRDKTSPLGQSKEGKTKHFRSNITENEKKEINKVIKQLKTHEKNSTEKTKLLLEKIQKIEQEEKKEKEKIFKYKVQNKRKQAEKNLSQIQKRKVQRTKSLNKLNKNYQDVAKKTFLYQEIDDKWKTIVEEREEQRKSLFEQSRQKKKFDYDEIKRHNRKYSQIANKYKDERQTTMAKFRQKLAENAKDSIYPRSTFLNRISEQDQFKKKKEKQKMQQSQFFSLKKTDYSQNVKKKNSKFKEKYQEVEVKQTRGRKSMDYFEIYKNGNGNMKQMHSCISEVAIQNSRLERSLKPSQQQFKYKDYLKEKQLRKIIENPQNVQNQQKKVLTRILNKNEDQDEKLFKAKLFAQKMDQKQSRSTKDMINGMRAKLAIIEHFEGE